jgi:hypothetical protein
VLIDAEGVVRALFCLSVHVSTGGICFWFLGVPLTVGVCGLCATFSFPTTV